MTAECEADSEDEQAVGEGRYKLVSAGRLA